MEILPQKLNVISHNDISAMIAFQTFLSSDTPRLQYRNNALLTELGKINQIFYEEVVMLIFQKKCIHTHNPYIY